MKRLLILLALVLTTLPPALAQQEETYDYQWCKREIVDHGMQALLMCNGLFTANRSLEQLFEQELKVLDSYLGKPHNADFEADWERKTVMVGLPGSASVMRAAYREGLGAWSLLRTKPLRILMACLSFRCRRWLATLPPFPGRTEI